MKQPRARVSAFVAGQSRQIVTLAFEMHEIGHYTELMQSTNEMYVDEAIRSILTTHAMSPPSPFAIQRQSHMALLAGFADRIDAVYKRKLSEAEKEAGNEITQYLLERGIIE